MIEHSFSTTSRLGDLSRMAINSSLVLSLPLYDISQLLSNPFGVPLYPSEIIEFGLDKGNIHPTQKPVSLMEYLIMTYSNDGEVVLDNCMGSGTTGVAAVKCNRSFIGIEMNHDYFRKASERINDVTVEEVSQTPLESALNHL